MISRRKLKTWAYLRLRLARPCVHLRWLAMTCVHFGRSNLHASQIKAGFSPFGHLTQVDASWVTSINLLFYGWRNGAKFTKFIFIHIQSSYWYSRIYLFTFNNRIYIQEIYLFTFTCVFLIHDYICSHLRDVFIHIQRVISIHIHDRNIHSTFSAHHLCASVSNKYALRSTDYGLRTGYKTRTQV